MLKYTVEFKDFNNANWRIEIHSSNHTGDAIQLTPSQNPLTIEKEGNTDDNPFYQHIIHTTAIIGVVSTGLDMEELLYINDASLECYIYYNTQLYFRGYIISDGIQEIDSGIPYDVTIKAIDGLEVLDNIFFSWADNYGTINGSKRRIPLNAIRLALYSGSNLGIELPVIWQSPYKRDNDSSDMLAGNTELNAYGDLSIVLDNDKTLKWWVDNILKSSVTWLFQQWGRWFIINYPTLVKEDGMLTVNEVVGTSDTTAPEFQVNLLFDANDFVNENAFWFGKKPFGTVINRYNAVTDDNNVVPNGGFEITDRYWTVTDQSTAYLTYEESINGRDGQSLQVDNTQSLFNPNPIDTYVTFGSIPLDTETLFKNATLGLKWLPMEGYAVDVDDFIDFTKFPINIRISYEFDNKTYFLNEFGYWSDKNIEPNQRVERYDYNPAQQWFNIQFRQNIDFEYGDVVKIQFIRNANWESYRIKFNESMSVTDGIAYIRTFINNTSSPNAWTLTIHSVDPAPAFNRASVEKEDDYYKTIEIEELGGKIKHGDVLDIQFNSSGKASSVKLPQGMGRLSFEIFSKANTKMRLDDVYFKVDDVNEQVEVSIYGTKNAKDEYEMEISSGFSGHQVSSFMERYDKANESAFWEGGKTMTEVYATEVLNMRNKPLRVFSGSIDGVIDWGLLEIKGKKYLPLSIKLNCKDSISDIVAVEAIYNPMNYDVKTKGD